MPLTVLEELALALMLVWGRSRGSTVQAMVVVGDTLLFSRWICSCALRLDTASALPRAQFRMIRHAIRRTVRLWCRKASRGRMSLRTRKPLAMAWERTMQA
jgi:hypothetical protein